MSQALAIFKKVKEISRHTHLLRDETIRQVLYDLAILTLEKSRFILTENERDLERMNPSNPRYDRLKLTQARLEDIATDLKNVASLRSPLGEVLEARTLENGLELQKVRVPLGVIGIIYEARPNVTFDVAALCLKTGNACLLKGGKDAEFSNKAILTVIHQVLVRHKISPNWVQMMPVERAATEEMLNAVEYVDLIIPRGSQELINFVRQNAKVPVIETGAGIVHTYFDQTADLEKGKRVVFNAKTRRVSVCNALDCLLVHRDRLKVLPALCQDLASKNVLIYADSEAYAALKGTYPTTLLQEALPKHFGTEFLDYKLAIKVVSGMEQALEHIAQHSSKHSEAILSESPENIQVFLNRVDAAVVYANASTAFTDGAQFGMGAEIGISTQKMHARGPMALPELTSYKWLVRGGGQIRNP